MNAATVAKWDCVASVYIDKQVKKRNKKLSMALSQIPDKMEGIIHPIYETVTGTLVGIYRHDKLNRLYNILTIDLNIHILFLML